MNKNSDKKDEEMLGVIFGYFLLANIVFWAIVLLFKLPPLPFVIVVLALGIFGIFITVSKAKICSIRSRRIVALLVIFCFLVNSFGCIYYIIFLLNPLSFIFSPSIAQGKVFNELDSALDELIEMNKQIYVVSILESNPKVALQMIQTRATSDNAAKFIEVSDDVYVRHYPFSMEHFHDYVYEFKLGEEKIRFSSGHELVDHASGVIDRLFMSKDIKELHDNIADTVAELRGRQRKTRLELESKLLEEGDFRLLDFWYFSTVTMTTLGYGDILPNSRIVRATVMCEAITGLFYVAYALLLIWPNSSED